MNFYYCLDLSRAGTRTHEKVSNWLKTGHENHQTRSTGTRRREPAPVYLRLHGWVGGSDSIWKIPDISFFLKTKTNGSYVDWGGFSPTGSR